jgi:histidinol dehydrogenase
MFAVPAKIAGCKEIVYAPPDKNGNINPAITVAANLCGLKDLKGRSSSYCRIDIWHRNDS